MATTSRELEYKGVLVTRYARGLGTAPGVELHVGGDHVKLSREEAKLLIELVAEADDAITPSFCPKHAEASPDGEA